MTHDASTEAIVAERTAIETARSLIEQTTERITGFLGECSAALDERETRNRERCPHERIERGPIGEYLGAVQYGDRCVACGLHIPGSVAGEGERRG